MFLKKLIISNFKTFNGAKELIFSKGYTVLSGPNGSGKSNTLDAILFVLGRHDERIKRTVAEVISKDFTSNKFLADFTEVTLEFATSDSPELDNEANSIIISRQLRIPASGKAYSVYKLNGNETTLNDLMNAIPIMDYNIVKQGEITSRMYETPESRRNLIEKIAGIAQLDPLISESTAKILGSKETLKRLGIFLKDAEKRLKKLETEKERALKYRELERELSKFKAIKLFSTKLELVKKLNEIEEQIQSKFDLISEIKTKIENHLQEINQFNNRLEALDKQKKEFEKKKTEVSIHYEMDLKRIEEINQRLEDINELIQALEGRINVLKEEIRTLREEKQKILSKIKKSTENQNQILEDIKEFLFQNKNLELALPRLKEKVKELDLKRDSVINQISEKDKNLRSIDLSSRELRQKRIGLEEKLEEYNELKEDQTSMLGKAVRELRQSEGKIKINKTNVEKLQHEIIYNRQLLEKQRLAIQEFAAKELELEKEIRYYQQLLETARPNYSNAVQRVLEARDRGELRGILGTVIELMDEINSEYAIAIEAAGGVKLQNIVTENFEITKKIIDYIKKIQVGKITFYPLDTLQDWQLKATPNDSKVIGKIIDLINYNQKKYLKVMANIFKNTLLVQDLDTANKYRSYRTVTIEGDLVEPGGWVTTRGKFEPRFLLIKEFYRKKIGDLTAELDKARVLSKQLKTEELKLEHQTKVKQDKIEELVEINNILKGRILEIQNKTKELEINIQKWEKELETTNNNLLETKAELQNSHIKLSKVLEELENLNQQKIEIEKEISNTELGKTEELIQKNRNEIQKLRESSRKFEKEREIFSTQVNQIESSVALKESRVEDIESRINQELIIERESLIIKRQEIFEKIEAENINIQSILGEIAHLENDQKELKENQQELFALINQNKSEIEIIKESVDNELQKNKIRIELRLQELDKQIFDLGFDIKEDFEVDLVSINQQIDLLEIEISSLGLIDYQAPEKYEAERIRLAELLAKKNTYEKELEEALGTKEDLLKQKELKFLRTISEINTYLEDIFIKLYGRGHASLILLDSKNTLQSGVDIRVDVGSGTVDYIGTLSGGEKSIIALAFIFAIQKYKPAPIYFLDEIDSYLDDSHCEALGHVLKELSKDSQYIIITPRLNALSTYADRIYGVWLENGITHIVCQHAEDFVRMEEV